MSRYALQAVLLSLLSTVSVAAQEKAIWSMGSSDGSSADAMFGDSQIKILRPVFENPLIKMQDAPDPWIVYHAGFYYFTATLDPDGGIWLWKTRTLASLDSAEKTKVYTSPATGARGKQIWAPELHRIGERWYIYYTASDGTDENHRTYVLESRDADPLSPYTLKARIFDPANDGWALDPSVFRAADGKLYFLWVGHVAGNGNGIYIAPMSNPWTLAGSRVLIAEANHAWERVRYPINEGPEILQRGGRTFLVYSASDTGTPDYALGLLTHTGGDFLDPASWVKSPEPVFKMYAGADGNVFGPGHNGFFKSPDGTEDWIIYHGKETRAYTYAGRTTRAQKFSWNPDGTPNFGRPIPRGVLQRTPSGEGVVGRKLIRRGGKG